jgi:methylated-DNA-[protein]-cysteine S-methyltransferase
MPTATQKAYVYKTITTPVGELKLVGSDRGLAAILWQNDKPGRVRLNIVARDDRHPVLLETQQQLGEYFAGRRQRFTVKLDFAGTDFQKQVWHALLAIPFGQTRSYGEIAAELGNPKAMRAVGAANGKNPISIIAPCHRVIGASGKLTGFAGGLETKAFLLDLESRKSTKAPRAA